MILSIPSGKIELVSGERGHATMPTGSPGRGQSRKRMELVIISDISSTVKQVEQN